MSNRRGSEALALKKSRQAERIERPRKLRSTPAAVAYPSGAGGHGRAWKVSAEGSWKVSGMPGRPARKVMKGQWKAMEDPCRMPWKRLIRAGEAPTPF